MGIEEGKVETVVWRAEVARSRHTQHTQLRGGVNLQRVVCMYLFKVLTSHLQVKGPGAEVVKRSEVGFSVDSRPNDFFDASGIAKKLTNHQWPRSKHDVTFECLVKTKETTILITLQLTHKVGENLQILFAKK